LPATQFPAWRITFMFMLPQQKPRHLYVPGRNSSS